MRQTDYPIQSIQPFSEHGRTGFDLEFRLDNGHIATVELRSDRPSWQGIKPLEPQKKPMIRIAAYNHDLLRFRTLDVEIHEVHLPAQSTT